MKRSVLTTLSTAASFALVAGFAAPVAAQTVDRDRIEARAAARGGDDDASREAFRAQREAMRAQRQAERAAAPAAADGAAAQRDALQAQREAFRAQRQAERTGAATADGAAAQRAAFDAQREAIRAQREAARAGRDARVTVAQAPVAAEQQSARDAELQRRGAEFYERYRRNQEAQTAAGRAAGVRTDTRAPDNVGAIDPATGRAWDRDRRQDDRRDWRNDRLDDRQGRRDDRQDWRNDRRDDVRDDRRDDRRDYRDDRRDDRRDFRDDRRTWNSDWSRRGWNERWAQSRYDRFGRPNNWSRNRTYQWSYNLDPRFGFGSRWAWDPFWSYDPSWSTPYGYYDSNRYRDSIGFGVRAEDLVRNDPIIGRWALTRYDRDRTGYLGPNETYDAARELLRYADLNGDRRISDREYRIALDRLQDLAYSSYGYRY